MKMENEMKKTSTLAQDAHDFFSPPNLLFFIKSVGPLNFEHFSGHTLS